MTQAARFVSTRGAAPEVGFSQAIRQGLAPDGGLYVPRAFPDFDPGQFDGERTMARVAQRVLAPFLLGDALAEALPEICAGAFDFPLEQPILDPATELLELFHGPTAAFKDFGARFLAECFERLHRDGSLPSLTILVATSGDTGSAVASAFHRRRGIRVAILFPDGGVSARQAHQLTCWGDNVHSLAVHGTFDDCQRLVKRAFREPHPRAGALSSANSINIGRLLPQAAYYACSSLDFWRRHGTPAGYVIPSGNLGNAVGAFWARRMGFPIGRIALACNANRPVPDWFDSGRWEPRASRATLANAMDVGDPSNMERLLHLYPDRQRLLDVATALSVDDATIKGEIARSARERGRVLCPHTATAAHFQRLLPPGPWIVVATAHPAKFEQIVEPLIGRVVEVPPRLAELLGRPTCVTRLEPELAQLWRELDLE